MRLDGKRAVVVGGGQRPGETIGLGRATAVLFAREGAEVLVVDRELDAAEETVKMIEHEGGRARAFRADIVHESQCAALAAELRERWGGLDILHHNVGITAGDASAEQISETAWRQILDTNLTGMWLTCKHVGPVMRAAPGGSIITVSSVAALMNGPEGVAYGVSKAAVGSLTRRLALEYAPHGIRVNSVLPGMIDTPIGVDEIVRRTGVAREEIVAARAAIVPIGRQGTAWDVAHAVLYFASADSEYVTGQSLVVDGGLTLQVGPVPQNAR